MAVVPRWPGSGVPAMRPGPSRRSAGVVPRTTIARRPMRAMRSSATAWPSRRERASARASTASRAPSAAWRGAGELERVQLRREVVLGARGAQGADRLLPGERRRRVGQDQQPGHDERGAERAPHRRSADSVPPSEPGPA